MKRLIFIAIALAVVARLYAVLGIEGVASGLVIVTLLGTMVWFNEFWAEYLLPFGFWASKASDFKTPQRSAAAVALLGWVLLMLVACAVYFLPVVARDSSITSRSMGTTRGSAPITASWARLAQRYIPSCPSRSSTPSCAKARSAREHSYSGFRHNRDATGWRAYAASDDKT